MVLEMNYYLEINIVAAFKRCHWAFLFENCHEYVITEPILENI